MVHCIDDDSISDRECYHVVRGIPACCDIPGHLEFLHVGKLALPKPLRQEVCRRTRDGYREFTKLETQSVQQSSFYVRRDTDLLQCKRDGFSFLA